MAQWEVVKLKDTFDGVWSQGYEYVGVRKDGKVVKEYSQYNPLAKVFAHLYVLRHKIFGG